MECPILIHKIGFIIVLAVAVVVGKIAPTYSVPMAADPVGVDSWIDLVEGRWLNPNPHTIMTQTTLVFISDRPTRAGRATRSRTTPQIHV
jgi:hypothetical protein